ncbi:MAG: glycosyltransferase family 2 protein [Candidatus Bathyarchaeum sp.]|nr:MAG: glycosyltransferase family 2 protein [Candidatus Bathyarchaeum sp.]
MLINISILTIALTIFTTIYYFMWLFLSLVHVVKKDEIIIETKFNPHPPLVSILLPCRDEESVISTVIEQTLNQTHKNLEIIVIAHNCTDKTAQIARQYQDPRVKLYELTTQEVGKGLGLNYGYKNATGDIIIYFDADSIIPEDYVENIVKIMDSKDYDLVQGKIIGANPDYNRLCFLQHMENQIFLSMFWAGKQKLGLPGGLGGTGVAIRKQALEDIGGFRNILIEDFDLCVRAQMAGHKIGYCKEAVIYDEKVPHYDMLIRQRSRWIAGHFQIISDLVKKRTLPKLFLKNPVDFFQLLSPFYTLCLWLGVFIGIISISANTLSQLGYLDFWISSWYIPLEIYVFQTILLQVFFVLILRKECKTKKELLKSVLNLPLFYIYSVHWFWVLVRTVLFRRKVTWAFTKTEHGFGR